MLIEPNGRLPGAKKARWWDWMGKPGEVLWEPPQGLYDGDGVRKKTVFDGRTAPPAPASQPAATATASDARTAETDATVTRLLRDLAVS